MIFLVGLTSIALILCYIIARPFLMPIISAIVISVIFYPLHSAVRRAIRSPSVAALVSTLLVMFIILLPAVMIIAAVSREVSEMYQSLTAQAASEGGLSQFLMHHLEKPIAWLSRYVDLSSFNLRQQIIDRLQQLSTYLLSITGYLVGNITSVVLNAAIALFTLFFVFREGRSALRRLAAIMPLTPAQSEKLFSGISNAIRATVNGSLSVAVAQGTLMATMFWFLGLPSPILWGVVTALVSLIPVLGSFVIWGPAALVLFLSGNWVKGLIMVGWGVGVVSTVDNLLRPYVMSGTAKFHTLLVFFAVLGGVQAFGIMGLFIGPVILAVTMALLDLLRDVSRSAPESQSEAAEEAPAVEGVK